MEPMTVKDSNTECRSIRPRETPAYLEFARLAWGKDSPQADPNRLSWLYEANPNTLGIDRDLLVLADGRRIVGAHHRMRNPWSVNGQPLILPSLHDLSVLPEYRHGGGLQLILAALAGESHVALFGLSQDADRIYERMRVPAIPLTWLYKIRSSVRFGLQFAGSRVGLRIYGSQSHRKEIEVEEHLVLRTATPEDSEIAEGLRIKANAVIYPDWNVASYRWRFFHKLGPENFMLLLKREGEVVGRAVISLGVRKGVGVGRIVELVFADTRALAAILHVVDQSLDDLHIPLAFAVLNSECALQALLRKGWKVRKEHIGSRWFSRKGQTRPHDLAIQGGVWDFGCDARRHS